MSPGQATSNTFAFIKENLAIILVFPAIGGALNATLRLQELAVFRFQPLFESGLIGAGITLLVLLGMIWIWNLVSSADLDES